MSFGINYSLILCISLIIFALSILIDRRSKARKARAQGFNVIVENNPPKRLPDLQE